MQPVVCPNCGTRDVTLEGVWQRRFTQVIKGGEPEPPTMAEQYSENIRSIICTDCEIQFIIQADEYINVNLDNMAMKLQMAQLSGRATPDKSTKVN